MWKKREFLKDGRKNIMNPGLLKWLKLSPRFNRNRTVLGWKFTVHVQGDAYIFTSEDPLSRKTPFSRLSAFVRRQKGQATVLMELR